MVRLYFGPKRLSALVLPADQEGWTVISIPSPETDAPLRLCRGRREDDPDLNATVRSKATIMKRTLTVGDHVTWNSEAGRVSGTIVKVHTKDVNYKGYKHHASADDPQYEIQSDKTDHVAMHKASALRLQKSHK
jgi:hypothetical protein